MSKTPAMKDALDGISESLFGRKRSECQNTAICVTCGEPVGDFSDALSRKEYRISGMCQVCQDGFFE